MNAQASPCTFIIPPVLHGQLSGVVALKVGARSVHVQLLGRTVRIRRNSLPTQLPKDYMELASLVRPIALRDGIDVDQPIVKTMRPSLLST